MVHRRWKVGTPSTWSTSISREIAFSIMSRSLPWSGRTNEKADAVVAHPAGPADPVDVVLGVFGQVEVDDVGDARDVDPAADDVGRHQGLQPAGAERVEDAVPLRTG